MRDLPASAASLAARGGEAVASLAARGGEALQPSAVAAWDAIKVGAGTVRTAASRIIEAASPHVHTAMDAVVDAFQRGNEAALKLYQTYIK